MSSMPQRQGNLRVTLSRLRGGGTRGYNIVSISRKDGERVQGKTSA